MTRRSKLPPRIPVLTDVIEVDGESTATAPMLDAALAPPPDAALLPVLDVELALGPDIDAQAPVAPAQPAAVQASSATTPVDVVLDVAQSPDAAQPSFASSPPPPPLPTPAAISPLPSGPATTHPEPAVHVAHVPPRPAIDEQALALRVMEDVQRQIDLMIEHRVSAALEPILRRLTENLAAEARTALALTLHDTLRLAVKQEIERARSADRS